MNSSGGRCSRNLGTPASRFKRNEELSDKSNLNLKTRGQDWTCALGGTDFVLSSPSIEATLAIGESLKCVSCTRKVADSNYSPHPAECWRDGSSGPSGKGTPGWRRGRPSCPCRSCAPRFCRRLASYTCKAPTGLRVRIDLKLRLQLGRYKSPV